MFQLRALIVGLAIGMGGSVGVVSGATDWLVVPGTRVGPISRETSEKDLKMIYGDRQVVANEIEVGEGQTLPGTTLFPGQPKKKLQILWKDKNRSRPDEVRIGEEGSLWKTVHDITIGTPLAELERLNGRAIALAGFGWDYSGTIFHCNDGALQKIGVQAKDGEGRSLLLRVAPKPEMQKVPEYRAVLGDGDFESSHPSMRKLNPVVYEMIVNFK